VAKERNKYVPAFSEDAKRQLGQLSAHDRSIIVDAIDIHLSNEPTRETRNRKPLRDSSLADWELRVGQYRVFYRVEKQSVLVLILAIGKKGRNRLLIEGKEYQL
jgi:mRNA interferase RelE/StbE